MIKRIKRIFLSVNRRGWYGGVQRTEYLVISSQTRMIMHGFDYSHMVSIMFPSSAATDKYACDNIS